MDIQVREMQGIDIRYIVDYWTKSDRKHLIAMGVDLKKIPLADDLSIMLNSLLTTPNAEKRNYALIVVVDNHAVGHVNINEIDFGHVAKMHLHIWNAETRKLGIGTEMIKLAIPIFFEKFELDRLLCEPYALNEAPNKTLEKVGFQFVKKYTTTPGSITFEQEVNQWEFTLETLAQL